MWEVAGDVALLHGLERATRKSHCILKQGAITMTMRKLALPALALAGLLAGTTGGSLLATRDAAAQASTTPPQAQESRPERHVDPTRHVEGRIAFLRAELKITDAQAPQFDRLAQAMRENAQERHQLFEQGRADRPESAVERLETRLHIGQLHTRQTERLLAAFKPLYDGLSEEQKKTADELMGQRLHRHHHG